MTLAPTGGTLGLMLTFWANPEQLENALLGGISVKASVETSVEIPDRNMALMLERPEITIPEIVDLLERTTRAIGMQVNKLKAKNVIERIGPDKGGHWRVLT
jgi:predicted HTH transcriptional regulator